MGVLGTGVDGLHGRIPLVDCSTISFGRGIGLLASSGVRRIGSTTVVFVPEEGGSEAGSMSMFGGGLDKDR